MILAFLSEKGSADIDSIRNGIPSNSYLEEDINYLLEIGDIKFENGKYTLTTRGSQSLYRAYGCLIE